MFCKIHKEKREKNENGVKLIWEIAIKRTLMHYPSDWTSKAVESARLGLETCRSCLIQSVKKQWIRSDSFSYWNETVSMAKKIRCCDLFSSSLEEKKEFAVCDHSLWRDENDSDLVEMRRSFSSWVDCYLLFFLFFFSLV